MRYRYVKFDGHEPGVRFDVLLRRDVYSSRFLNNEEHGPMISNLESAWAAIYCFFTGTLIGILELFFMAFGIAAFLLMLVLFANGTLTLGG